MKGSSERKRGCIYLSIVLFVVMSLAFLGLQWLITQQVRSSLNRNLINALRDDDAKTALALVEAGADPNTPVFNTEPAPPTLFDWVKQLYHPSVPDMSKKPTAFMVVCGSWLTIGDKVSFYPIDWNDIEVNQWTLLCKSMLAHGATVDLKNEYGESMLMAASHAGRASIMRLLLARKVPINLRDERGRTALHYAVTSRRLLSVRLLIDYFVDVNIIDKKGATPLRNALDDPACPHEIIRLLKQAGARE